MGGKVCVLIVGIRTRRVRLVRRQARGEGMIHNEWDAEYKGTGAEEWRATRRMRTRGMWW